MEKILKGLFQEEPFLVTFVYSEEGISYRIDDNRGNILGEAYRGSSAEEIKSMSDGELENLLRELLANTHRLLTSPL